MTKIKKVFEFEKGQLTDIDYINNMNLFLERPTNKNWWEKTGMDVESGDPIGTDMGDEAIVTRTVKFTIIVEVDD